MGADPIGALPVGQGNAERVKGHELKPPFEGRSHGLAFNFYSTIARSHGRTRVGMQNAGSEVLVILAASRRRGLLSRHTILASLMAAWGNPDMRVLLAWLIVLGAFAGSATACAIWGSRKVAAHVRIETSCMLLDAAEKEGWISRSARFDLMQKVATSSKTSAAVRDAADRMRSGCPGRKVP
jgi:hypothetical protein